MVCIDKIKWYFGKDEVVEVNVPGIEAKIGKK